MNIIMIIAFNASAASLSYISLHIHTYIVFQNLEHKCHFFVIIDPVYTVHRPTTYITQTFDSTHCSLPTFFYKP